MTPRSGRSIESHDLGLGILEGYVKMIAGCGCGQATKWLEDLLHLDFPRDRSDNSH